MEKEEILKDIIGYEGIYQISNWGRVYSMPKQCSPKGRFLKFHIDDDGYCLVCLANNGCNKTKKVHRLVAQHFIENPENKKCVNHKNSIKTDNFESNLEWCTNEENMAHAKEHGLVKSKVHRGEKSYNSILTEENVRQIRLLHPQHNQRELAKMFNINYRQIWKVIHRKTWQHII